MGCRESGSVGRWNTFRSRAERIDADGPSNNPTSLAASYRALKTNRCRGGSTVARACFSLIIVGPRAAPHACFLPPIQAAAARYGASPPPPATPHPTTYITSRPSSRQVLVIYLPRTPFPFTLAVALRRPFSGRSAVAVSRLNSLYPRPHSLTHPLLRPFVGFFNDRFTYIFRFSHVPHPTILSSHIIQVPPTTIVYSFATYHAPFFFLRYIVLVFSASPSIHPSIHPRPSDQHHRCVATNETNHSAQGWARVCCPSPSPLERAPGG
ncbi:hypothetical protein B0H11DRAFT_36066 [Mycena galericulata]|nr:hypothetical protein B0H11DRAFT_36066 [Mycena galericulata]